MRNGLAVLIACGLVMSVAAPVAVCADPNQNASEALSAANNAFAVDVYREIKTGKGNIFFSPFTLASALAIAAEGAQGRTAEQMKAMLHLGPLNAALQREACRSLYERLTGGGDKSYQLLVANGLWGATGYHFREAFLKVGKGSYHGDCRSLNFAQKPEVLRAVINKAVENGTMGMVQDILPPGSVNASTSLLITNAACFNGAWQNAFKTKQTRDTSFYLSNVSTANAHNPERTERYHFVETQKTSVLMMEQTENFSFSETEKLQILKMGYRGGDVAMVVLLPKDRYGLPELEDALTADTLKQWLERLDRQEPVSVDVYMPKFQVASSFSAGKIMKALGMTDGFGAGADFSWMSIRKGLFVSEVWHSAVCSVDEKGDEAAPATTVPLSKSIGWDLDRPIFRADHPFIYLIIDERSNAVLFIGRMEYPDA